MIADFDTAATTYDRDFTRSSIGILQRERVWKYLNLYLNKKTDLKVLELNCGTGEDASILYQKGHQVFASDVSLEMLKIAQSKNKDSSITFFQLDLRDIDVQTIDNDFDLVFSNFGGLNCCDSDSMSKLEMALTQILKPKGEFIAVVMPKICIWEILYLTIKGKFSQVFRRNQEFVNVDVSGNQVKTWYYSPKKFDLSFTKKFMIKNLKPIGLFLPPSYMENFFRKNPKILKLLNRLESSFANHSWQAKFSDHYLIHYSLK